MTFRWFTQEWQIPLSRRWATVTSVTLIWFIYLILHNQYMAHLCKHLHMPEYATSNHALFTDVFCSPEVIHVPCNILGYHLVWPVRFVAVSVFVFFGLWPFRFLTVSVLWPFGLWPFRFVAVSVCGRFGKWPFRFVAVSVVAVSVCGRYDLLPSGHPISPWAQPIYRVCRNHDEPLGFTSMPCIVHVLRNLLIKRMAISLDDVYHV